MKKISVIEFNRGQHLSIIKNGKVISIHLSGDKLEAFIEAVNHFMEVSYEGETAENNHEMPCMDFVMEDIHAFLEHARY